MFSLSRCDLYANLRFFANIHLVCYVVSYCVQIDWNIFSILWTDASLLCFQVLLCFISFCLNWLKYIFNILNWCEEISPSFSNCIASGICARLIWVILPLPNQLLNRKQENRKTALIASSLGSFVWPLLHRYLFDSFLESATKDDCHSPSHI